MNAVAPGAGVTQKASIVDTAGYDGVMFVGLPGSVTDGAVVTLKAAVDDVSHTVGHRAARRQRRHEDGRRVRRPRGARVILIAVTCERAR